MNFSFFLIGSTHSFVDDFLKQEEIIKSVKPEFVLSEELENLKLDTEDKVKEILKEDEERLNKIVEEREKLHLSKILEYKSKTKRPLVIILGCWHLRENSLLRKKLKNYKIIAPLDENGGVLFEPNNSEIKYGEIISNEE